MSDYFTSNIDALTAYAAIEAEKTIIADTVDGYVKIDKAIEEHGATAIGNKAELFKRLVDYAMSQKATGEYKSTNKDVLDTLKQYQEVEKVDRRNLRTALLQAIQAQNLVHPLDSDKDNKQVQLPPLLSFEAQTKVFYDKREVLAYCLKYMDEFITIDWGAFDRVMAKTNGYRDNQGNSIFDDPNKPLPPVTIGRVAREVIAKDIDTLPDNLSEIEFSDDSEMQAFFEDVWSYHDENETMQPEKFMGKYLPQYADIFRLWVMENSF